MKLVLWRILLAPLTSLRALLIQQRGATPMSYDVAWRQARLHRCPDDMVYRLHGHQATTPDQAPNTPSRKDEPTDRHP
ncbi:hypothetical protein ACWC5C_19500 [Streptomyces sp. NPDC001700]